MLESKGYQQSEREPMGLDRAEQTEHQLSRQQADKTREKAYGIKYATPTPSITVGTQVRLTGVVTGPTRKSDEAIGVQIDGATAPADMVFVVPTALEVIRQPFKRGEVVYSKISATNEEPYVVLNDESLGMVDVTCCRTGFYIANDNPEAYERRP